MLADYVNMEQMKNANVAADKIPGNFKSTKEMMQFLTFFPAYTLKISNERKMNYIV